MSKTIYGPNDLLRKWKIPFKMEELSQKIERVTLLRNTLMQLNISTLGLLGHPVINGVITKQLILNLYSCNFYIKNNIKTKD
jgi:hypothetical protein